MFVCVFAWFVCLVMLILVGLLPCMMGLVGVRWAVWFVVLLLLVYFKLFACCVGLFGLVCLMFVLGIVVYLFCCFGGLLVVG